MLVKWIRHILNSGVEPTNDDVGNQRNQAYGKGIIASELGIAADIEEGLKPPNAAKDARLPAPKNSGMIAARLDREANAQTEPKVSIPGNLRPRRINRVIIELCCADDSRLGQLSRSSEGCLIVRVTESDDLTREDTIKKVLWFAKNVQSHKIPVLIWLSIPCTGGTRLTDLNWVVGTDKTRELIENHRTLYLKLFHSLR